jgi:hypothetical protein
MARPIIPSLIALTLGAALMGQTYPRSSGPLPTPAAKPAAKVAASQPAAAASQPGVLVGIEGLLKGYPADKLPRYSDPNNELRYKLLNEWLAANAGGKAVVLRTKFRQSSVAPNGILVSVGNFRNRTTPELASAFNPPMFSAVAVVPQTEADKLLALSAGADVVLSGTVDKIEAHPAQSDHYPAFTVRLNNAQIEKINNPAGRGAPTR